MEAVMPGAEAWSAAGGRVGALVLHGFTGNPVAVRPLAEDLAAAGLAVELPRLPGHGTRWQDLQRTTAQDWTAAAADAFDRLVARTDRRVVVGLSFGAALALDLAARRPADVDGVVAVNPWVHNRDIRLTALPILKRLWPGLPGIGNDIALPGADEKPYPTLPLKALHSAVSFQRGIDFAAVTAPLLVMTSRRDHLIPPENSAFLLEHVGSSDTEQVWLEYSFHVATLDHDAPVISARTIAFAERVTEVADSEA